MSNPAASTLAAGLETAALRALTDEWHSINAAYFKRALLPPSFELSDTVARLGLWVGKERRIELSRKLVFEQPWAVAVEVLKHEVAHQYVQEVLRVTDETAHGEAFRSVCGKLGIDAAASGMPEAGARGDEEERVLAKVAKLLALAESPNENEAQSAMNAAQKLMLKYNLSLVEAPRRAGYHFRQLGEPTGRMGEAERLLGNILHTHFFVEVIYISAFRVRDGQWGRALEISGTRANVELAHYVYDFLHGTAARLWAEHRARHGIESNRDRRTFLAGVMRGFDEKLASQKEEHRKEGLVWVPDAELKAYYRQRHPHVRTVQYGTSSDEEAYAHGREAGRQIVLHRPVSEGSSGGAPRLLGSGRR